MGTVYDNARRVLARIAAAEQAAGLPPGAVTLVAASKLQGPEAIREALDAGVTNFGENRAQELEDKLAQNAYEGAGLHFIGHLQRNKVRAVVGRAALIHSVDSPELAERIGKRAAELGLVQRVLVEVNIGREPQKSGVLPEDLPELLAFMGKTMGIFVNGLMAIPPAAGDIQKKRQYFEEMRELFVDMSAKKYDNSIMSILSMGMSADFEEAIACGSNMVRVGSAIFGPRTSEKESRR